MNTPAIGPMRAIVQIQTAQESRRPSGQVDRIWVTIATVRGSYTPLAGQELWLAQQVRSQVTHRVYIRWYEGLTTAHRFVVDGMVFNIQSVTNPDAKRRFAECLCTQEV